MIILCLWRMEKSNDMVLKMKRIWKKLGNSSIKLKIWLKNMDEKRR